MASRTDDRQLFGEATDLAIRLQDDPGDPASIAMLKAWIGRSPEHAAVWARVSEIHGMAGKVLSDRRASEKQRKLTRRKVVGGGALGIGAVAAASWGVPRAITVARSDHRTAMGRIDSIELPDASQVTLGPRTALAVHYTPGHRRIDLLSGMAYFRIERDVVRPFAVVSGALTATAAASAFELSNDAGFVTVAVERGRVEARASRAPSRDAEQLNAGSWITLDRSGDGFTRGSRQASQIASWRSGLLVADNESVAAVIAKISRWHSGSVLIASPALASRRVSGVFDLRDPVQAMRAVIRPFGGRVRTVGGLATIISHV